MTAKGRIALAAMLTLAVINDPEGTLDQMVWGATAGKGNDFLSSLSLGTSGVMMLGGGGTTGLSGGLTCGLDVYSTDSSGKITKVGTFQSGLMGYGLGGVNYAVTWVMNDVTLAAVKAGEIPFIANYRPPDWEIANSNPNWIDANGHPAPAGWYIVPTA
jgi:hypothetical protein